jgi:PPOX class probable F420-dependent enzyme
VTHPLSTEEIVGLLGGPSNPTATVATVRPDGRPHAAPVWFVLDPATADEHAPFGDLIFTTDASSVKGRNLARDPRVSICVDDPRPPFAFCTIEGTATLADDLGELARWATAIGGRYMGAEQAEAFGVRNAVPGELLVRVRPRRVHAVGGMTD